MYLQNKGIKHIFENKRLNKVIYFLKKEYDMFVRRTTMNSTAETLLQCPGGSFIISRKGRGSELLRLDSLVFKRIITKPDLIVARIIYNTSALWNSSFLL